MFTAKNENDGTLKQQVDASLEVERKKEHFDRMNKESSSPIRVPELFSLHQLGTGLEHNHKRLNEIKNSLCDLISNLGLSDHLESNGYVEPNPEFTQGGLSSNLYGELLASINLIKDIESCIALLNRFYIN